MRPPTILVSGRVFITASYLWPEKFICIQSGESNETYVSDYFKAGRDEGKQLAKSIIAGHYYEPLYDPLDCKRVIGTLVVFVNESDFGGLIPKWLIQKLAPPGINDFYEDLVKDVKIFNKI